jgi:RimJ/RimL family protein N-acetyltransferase
MTKRRFVSFFRRLIRAQSHFLFSAPIEEVANQLDKNGLEFITICTQNVSQHRVLIDALVALNPDNTQYIADIEKDKITGLVVLENGQVVHYGFVFKSNKTAQLLGLHPGTALIGNSFTTPDCRGQGLQVRSVCARAEIAKLSGFTAIAAETHPENHASQRGLMKSGMKLQGRVELLILLSCFVVRWRRPAGVPLLGFCL